MLFAPASEPFPLPLRETALISAGAAILGGFLGGFFSGTFLHFYEWLKRPKLQLDYKAVKGANEVEAEYTKEGNQVADIYVRARVRNTGKRVARSCCVFLTSLEEVQPSGTTPTVFHDAMQLAWAGSQFVPRDVPRGVEFYVDILRVSKHSSGWSFSVQKLFANQAKLKDFRGTYRFHLLATADNALPARLAVDVSYNGDWHNLRAIESKL